MESVEMGTKLAAVQEALLVEANASLERIVGTLPQPAQRTILEQLPKICLAARKSKGKKKNVAAGRGSEPGVVDYERFFAEKEK